MPHSKGQLRGAGMLKQEQVSDKVNCDKMRSLSEILIDADAADDIRVLNYCWMEIYVNRRKYTLAEIDFAKEHLLDLAKKLAKRHAQLIVPYIKKLFKL